MKRRYFIWGVRFALGVLLVTLLGVFYFTQIAPLQNKKLSTIPEGVTRDNPQGQPNVASNAQAPATILATPIVASAAVSLSYDQSTSFRLDIVDRNNRVIEDGASVTVTLSSSSVSGKFESTTAAFIPRGRLSQIVKYSDTASGKATITAFVSGLVSGSVALTLTSGPAVGLSEILPATRSPKVGQTTIYRVSLLDAFGNAAGTGQIDWEISDSADTKGKQQIMSDSNGLSRYSYTPAARTAGSSFTLVARFLQQKQMLQITPVL